MSGPDKRDHGTRPGSVSESDPDDRKFGDRTRRETDDFRPSVCLGRWVTKNLL